MELNQLKILCYEAIDKAIDSGRHRDAQIIVVGDKFPKGFPRGELLSDNDSRKVYRFSAIKVLVFIIQNIGRE